MAMIKNVFGTPQREIWKEVSGEVGAEFVRGGVWKADKLVAKVKDWEIVMDTYAVSTGKVMIDYTRMRAPFVSNDGLRFHIYRKSFFTKWGKWFGMSDIEVGYSDFDDSFVVQGNDPEQIIKFCGNRTVRDMLFRQKRFDFKILDDEGWLGSTFPPGVDELYFEVVGVIKDKEQIKSLFALFSASLHQLNQIGSAQNQPTQVQLK